MLVAFWDNMQKKIYCSSLKYNLIWKLYQNFTKSMPDVEVLIIELMNKMTWTAPDECSFAESPSILVIIN